MITEQKNRADNIILLVDEVYIATLDVDDEKRITDESDDYDDDEDYSYQNDIGYDERKSTGVENTVDNKLWVKTKKRNLASYGYENIAQ